MTKIAINGFGRIGRLTARIILDKHKDKLDLVAINTSGNMDAKGWANLFTHDSIYRDFAKDIKVDGDSFVCEGKKIKISGERDPEKIPWQDTEPDLVLECTGVFRKEKDVRKILKGTVKKIVMSAPAKEGNIPMFVLGVNDKEYKGEEIISCASCTTNCVAPLMFVLESKIGIKKAMLNTVHAYTSDQSLLDGSHKDWRRARAAAINIIPTSTGAAKATGQIIKELENLFDGLAVRVPVASGSLADIVFVSKKKTDEQEINSVLEQASQTYLKDILKFNRDELVSSDVIGSNYSSVLDSKLTRVIDGDLVRVVSWYDNEWGYTNRLVELAIIISGFKQVR